MVSTIVPGGLFYANAIGDFGSVSFGQNWGRLASAAHRWALKLVDEKGFDMLIFSGDAGPGRKWDLLGVFFSSNIPLMIPWYPFIAGKYG